MKVCTDARILGAWFAEKIPSYSTVLDIGSGTGLLMLMLAQKNKALISGIEIDLPSYKQLKENIEQSPWKQRIYIYPGDVRQFAFPEKFDFIISNPPFFENDLPSKLETKNIAKHSKELSLNELMEVIDTNLDKSGSFGLLLPYHRTNYFEELALKHQFHLNEKLSIKQTAKHDFFRSILHFSRNKVQPMEDHILIIQGPDGKYSEEFTELLKDYYLKL